MENSANDSILFTPGFLFRVLRADTTIKDLFGEHRVHYQTVSDLFNFFSEVKIFGLESPIGTEAKEGGYYFPITCEELARLAEQIQGKQNSWSESIANNPVWQRIIAFSNKWSTDKLLQDGLQNRIWFEFDVCGLPPRVPVPSIFFRTLGNDNSGTAVLSGLEAFAVKLPVTQQDLLVTALRVLGPVCSFFEVGLLLARPYPPLRLNAFRVNWPDILERLKLLGINTLEDYPDFWQEFYLWCPYVLAVNLDIDTSNFGIKIGINFEDPGADTIRLQRQSTFWPEFLEWLVHKGWCLPHKKQAILNWSGGYRYHPDPYDFTGGHKAIMRTFSHVKLDFQPNRSPRAKVYLEYCLN